jgi:DNA-binding NarL/FixJ family response regulator
MDRSSCVIVDDHEVVRAGTRARLAEIEWIDVVGEAGTVGDALELIRATRPHVALVDMRLPGGSSGTSLVRELLRARLETRAVLYSGFVSEGLAQQALAAGAWGFVLKDSPLSCVVDALRSARDGRRYLDPAVASDVLHDDGAPRALSGRELQVLLRMADGEQNATIAHDLRISAETVKAHVSNILEKLGVHSRTAAVSRALRAGVID